MKLMKGREKGNPIFDISAVKHGGEEARKIRLSLQTRQVNARRQPLQQRGWPEEEETESLLQVDQDSVPTRFEPGASVLGS